MQTSTDRRRLMRMYCDDPTAHSWFLVGRCGAGLAIIALVAVIGVSGQGKAPDASEIASMRASPRAVTQPGEKPVREGRQRTATDPDSLIPADMVAGQADARQPTMPLAVAKPQKFPIP
jgi:hypothetical protein